MRKWLTTSAVAALVLILAIGLRQPPKFDMGHPLPAGKVAPQLVCNGDAAVLLSPDGSLWAWGGARDGLTNFLHDVKLSKTPRRIGRDSDWVQVAAGANHALAIKRDGSLWGWGRNDWEQLGKTFPIGRYTVPNRIGDDTNWLRVGVGFSHSLALKTDGSLWSWGLDGEGQLGNGSIHNSPLPARVGADSDWAAIAAGSFSSIALKKNGALWFWGSQVNFTNSLAPMEPLPGTTWSAISAQGLSFMALKSDGTIWLAPSATSGFPPGFHQLGNDRNWKSICAGEFSCFARKRDGSWWGCGNNGGQIGLDSEDRIVAQPRRLPENFEPWAFALGGFTTVILGPDGRLWTRGERLGAPTPSSARENLDTWLWPLVRPLPGLQFLLATEIDWRPHLVFELPIDVRRSLKAQAAVGSQ
jgi:alpha-tubulin suppressor-like RCC1 family protein